MSDSDLEKLRLVHEKEVHDAAIAIQERLSNFILEMRGNYKTPAELVAFLTLLIESALDIFACVHLAYRANIDEHTIDSNVKQFRESLRERALSVNTLLNDFEDHIKLKYNFKD